MAILCEGLKLLFIQTPHTGCTAIGSLLRTRFDGIRVPEEHVRQSDMDGGADRRIVAVRKHATLRQLMTAGLVTNEQRQQLVVAAGVRNPFDMMVSEFVRTTGTEDPRRRRGGGTGPRPERTARGPRPTEFEPWLLWRFSARALDRLRGARYETPPDFAAGVDHVVRYEHLQSDFAALLARVGVTEDIEVPLVNRTVGRHGRRYPEFYTPGARRIVSEVYAGWIERFGYRFDEAA